MPNLKYVIFMLFFLTTILIDIIYLFISFLPLYDNKRAQTIEVVVNKDICSLASRYVFLSVHLTHPQLLIDVLFRFLLSAFLWQWNSAKNYIGAKWWKVSFGT